MCSQFLERLSYQDYNPNGSLAHRLPLYYNILSIKDEDIKDALLPPDCREHFLEHVGKFKGAKFINDSMSTNINHLWHSLEAIETSIILIAGGVRKNEDYSIITNDLLKKVRKLIILGKNNYKLNEYFKEHVENVYQTQSMKEAVNWAYDFVKPGETVLLSPGHPSYDLFEDKWDRGNKFKEQVNQL